MKNKPDFKNYKPIILVVLVSIVVIGFFMAIASPPAKENGLDVLFNILFAISFLGLGIYLLKLKWNAWRLRSKWGLALLMMVILFIAVNDVALRWSRLPWVKTEAFSMANELMTNLKEKDYDAVLTQLTPRMQKCVDLVELNQPDDQPVNWKLEKMDEFSNIKGTATFSDGQALPLTVRMEWSNNQWQINGFWFVEFPNEKLDYSNMNCGK